MCTINNKSITVKKSLNTFMVFQLKRVSPSFEKIGLPLALVLLITFFTFNNSLFPSFYNLLNIGRQMVTLLLVSYGMTFVIIAGGIDLSVGSIMAVVSIVVSIVLVNTSNIFLGIMSGILTGICFGIATGYIVAYNEVQPFAVSLGMMSVANGLALIFSNGNTIRGLPKSFSFIGNSYFLGVPIQIWFMLVFTILVYLLLQKTTFGAYCYAVGGSKRVANLSGINVVKIRMTTFIISGTLAACASIIATSRCISGQPTLGADTTLQAIAASVIGGASLSGGRGSIFGTLMGVLIVSILYNGMNIIGGAPYVQDVFIGLIIIVAALTDTMKRRVSG